MKKKWLKLFALLLTALLSVSMFSGCIFLAALIDEATDKGDEAFELVGEPTISWVFDEEYGTYEVSVDGVAKNVTDEDWDGVDVMFLLYDAEGNGLGSASDYIDFVSANGTWRFCAKASTKYEPASVELHKLYAYDYDGIF